jgi:hypothetical protein
MLVPRLVTNTAAKDQSVKAWLEGKVVDVLPTHISIIKEANRLVNLISNG